MNYGLVCISEILKDQDKDLSFKTITRKRFLQLEDEKVGSGILVLESRILHNLNITKRIIEHCAESGIFHYRLSSALFPLMTEPNLKLQLKNLSNYAEIREICESIGSCARELGVSLSLHPDQFNVLASEKSSVVEKTINELNFHANVMDMMNLPQDYSCPINIHPSLSVKQDSEEEYRKLVDRFYAAFSKCNTGVRNRLVIENEDKGSWNCANLFMYFYNYCGTKHNHFFPLTYDNLHDYCNPSVFQNNKISLEQNVDAFLSTWPDSFVPVFHWSWGKEDKARSHADYCDKPPITHNKSIKWEIELKAKDKAIFKIMGKTLPTNKPPAKRPRTSIKNKPKQNTTTPKLENPSSPPIIHEKQTNRPFSNIYKNP